MEFNNRLLIILGIAGILTAFNAYREIQRSTDLVSENAQKIEDIYNYGFPIVLVYYSQKARKHQNVSSKESVVPNPSLEKVKSLSLEEFLTELSFILQQQKTYTKDEKMLQKMKEIGVRIGKPFSMGNIGPLEREYYRLIPQEVQSHWQNK
ncbi:hypothetical protein [Flammeovirga sp. EKP202]|uniref:hypothetical protein n=1 Tax=Flammeovirga sp. EKP202 TaxID=2770592 RepID=UPI00165FA78E|nr:hypothetical protein [Flammeovirga sp. EKP202]MBD0400708.1 hypothetical protein [Flammeovirga sp. EKP202]